jgi:O-antigen/teichoic acid export membrane protein
MSMAPDALSGTPIPPVTRGGTPMRKRIVSNLVYSALEKSFLVISAFVISWIVIRNLSREDYGIIGIVSGYFVFINFFNVTLDLILYRDYKQYEERLDKYLYNFLVFNAVKSLVFVLLAGGIFAFLYKRFANPDFAYAAGSAVLAFAASAITSPFIIYTICKFEQKAVMRISVIRFILDAFLVCGLFLLPRIGTIFVKDAIVLWVYVSVWFAYAKRHYGFDLRRIRFRQDFDMGFIKRCFFGYSLWTHLNGVVSYFVFKSDTFFLSFFVSLTTVGNYNIALIAANIIDIIPQILSGQNNIALSSAADREQGLRISNAFLRISLYFAVLALAGYYAFGLLFTRIITGQPSPEIYHAMMWIVMGTIVMKILVSPLHAYINIKGSVRGLFVRVLLPTFVATAAIYFLAAKIYGAPGVAYSKSIIAALWMLLLIWEIRRYDYKLIDLWNYREDLKILAGLFKR